ncbi:MAG: hypothetical protein IPL73_19920 [Candidatus Obscuribacter sp.]|nr:hypothetical protein [Candidatus Obscuribacter sp.]
MQSVSRGRGGYGPSIRMDLGNNLVITTSVGIWDGKAFLSFMPFKPQ